MPETCSGRFRTSGMTQSKTYLCLLKFHQVFDWLLTFDLEVAFVWGSKWNFGKIMFFLNRYNTFAEIGLAYVREFFSFIWRAHSS